MIYPLDYAKRLTSRSWFKPTRWFKTGNSEKEPRLWRTPFRTRRNDTDGAGYRHGRWVCGAEVGGFQVNYSFTELDDQAFRVLSKYGFDSLPVDPVAVAKALGYNVRAVIFKDGNLSGQIVKANNAVRIDVEARDPASRQRFTVAHEIGHGVLMGDRAYGSFRDKRTTIDGAGTKTDEMQANRFAAALLMPREWLEREYARNNNISVLARRFGVSSAAMSFRLKSLGLV